MGGGDFVLFLAFFYEFLILINENTDLITCDFRAPPQASPAHLIIIIVTLILTVFICIKATGWIEACNFIKKDTPSQVLCCEFCKIYQSTYFTGHFQITASVNYKFRLLG